MKLSDMVKPVPNAPELSNEQAKANLDAWSSKYKPAKRSDGQFVVAGILLFFGVAYMLATDQMGLPSIQNTQIETPRGPNAEERAALRQKMAKYHQPRALYNLIFNGQE